MKLLKQHIVSLIFLGLAIAFSVSYFRTGDDLTAWLLMIVALYIVRAIYWEYLWKKKNTDLQNEIQKLKRKT